MPFSAPPPFLQNTEIFMGYTNDLKGYDRLLSFLLLDRIDSNFGQFEI